jgi:hypothetical protein
VFTGPEFDMSCVVQVPDSFVLKNTLVTTDEPFTRTDRTYA